MKKITILLLAIIATNSFVIAQQIKKMENKAATLQFASESASSTELNSVAKPHRTSATAFYTQDFAGGIPAGWSNTGYYIIKKKNQPSVDSVVVNMTNLWEGRTMVGADTLGSRGAYTTKLRIKSPTVANGFVIFDSDYLDNGGVVGAIGAGTAPAPHKGVLASNTINCSGHPSVLLHFNEYFRRFAARTFVLVSNGTKDSLYEVNVKYPIINAATPNASEVILNITDIAANQANVTISFVFDGSQDYPGAVGKGYYFWQIDDVELHEGLAGDLASGSGAYANYFNEGLESQVPFVHRNTGFVFYHTRINYSPDSITNVRSKVVVTNTTGGANTIVNTLYSPLKTLKAFSYDSIRWIDTITNVLPSIGTYKIDFSVESPTPDADLSNNQTSCSYAVEVTSNTFAREEGKAAILFDTHNSSYGGKGFKVMNQYRLTQTDQVNSISVYLGGASTIGSKFEVQLLDTGFKKIAASETYTIATGDPGTFVTIPLSTITPAKAALRIVPAGIYYATVYCYAQDQTTTPKQKIEFAEDNTFPQPNNTSILIDSTNVYPGGYNGYPFLLRMSVDGVVGIASIASQNGITLSQNVPNPFSGVSTISYSIAAADKVTLEVTDITGRKVAEINEGVKAAGSYEIPLNANDYTKGIYFYTLRVGTTSLTKKMVITQ